MMIIISVYFMVHRHFLVWFGKEIIVIYKVDAVAQLSNYYAATMSFLSYDAGMDLR